MGSMNSGEAMNDEILPEAAAVAASTDSGPATPDPLPAAPPPAPTAATPAHTGAVRSGHSLWRWVALSALIVAVAVGAFFLGRWAGDDGSDNAVAVTTTIVATGNTIGTTDEPVADVAAALSPSVVQIETNAGLGSGFIFRADGYILTAAHVVDGSNQVTVRLADGTRLDGTVVGADANSDVAVVHVDQTGLPAALLADDA
jgi:S1-C subfamily serine protease